jgi:peptidyl-prolyl cis-trans isomerase B (cyclophilin B)
LNDKEHDIMRRFLAVLGVLFAMSTTEVLADNPKVLFKTNHGDITVELYADKAPKTVANFLTYVKNGHYNGTIFHRVIKDFMIQGGGFTPDMNQKPTLAPVENEADNGLKNTIGTIAMARTNDPHSATAQFFINTTNNDFLDFREKTPRAWGYAVFGKVVDGMKTVNEIRGVATGRSGMHQDVPKEPVIIQEARQL